MSHISLAKDGLAAVEKRNWDVALTKLTEATKQSANPAWLLGRSRALVGVKRFAEALEDAELAWHSAYSRSNRLLMCEAHYRRAVAYLRMNRLADADCCCVYSMRIAKGLPVIEAEDPKLALSAEDGTWKQTEQDAKDESSTNDIDKTPRANNPAAMASLQDAGKTERGETVRQWRMASVLRGQALYQMDQLPADSEARKVTVTQKPPKKDLTDHGVEVTKKTKKTEDVPAPAPVPAPSKPAVAENTPLRMQDYQNNNTMTVSIFSKGNKAENLKVDFLPFQVHVSNIIYPSGDVKELSLDLWAEIDPEASGYKVTPNKVELSLAKKKAGRWDQLKGEPKTAQAPVTKQPDEAQVPSAEKAVDTKDKDGEVPAPAATEADTQALPVRPARKDWENLDVDNSDEESDVNQFFKKLYKNATPEQQRAMMKSFTESSGTSLSTDWNDVKDRHVDAVPPEGVEAKKWD